MDTKRITSIILAAAFALLILLPACSSDSTKKNNTNETAATSGDNATETESVVEEEYKIPEVDYGGYVIRLLTMDESDWAISNLDTEEETGEPVNDEMYRRNRKVEEALNITIQEIPSSYNPEEKFNKSVRAGLDEYDLMFSHAHDAGPIASSGLYLNLPDISSLNLDQPYWDQGSISSFTLMNKLYFTASDACVMTNDAIWVVYYNKKMAEELGLENPYQMVREGVWTADAMQKMAREAVKDIDGDGKYGAGDKMGITSHSLAFLEFLECMGEQLVKKDGNGYPVLTNPGDRFVGAFDKIRELMNTTNGVYLDIGSSFPGKTSDLDHARKVFMSDMALFCAEVLGHSRFFREMTADFGILPHPKYDESQATYLNATADTVPVVGIPITNPDPERTGAFLDALTALSAATVTPAYYTISLEGKFTRDEDSIEMLDIIRSNRVYDLAVIYNWGSFYSTIISQGTSKNGGNPVTVFERNRVRVESQISNTVTAFEAID